MATKDYHQFAIHTHFAQLLAAIRRADKDLIKNILITQKAENLLAIRDRTGRTALHHCADQPTNHVDSDKIIQITELLLQQKGDIIDAQDNEGNTALHLAVINGNLPLTNLLLSALYSAKNNPTKEQSVSSVNVGDYELHTAVHWATVCGELECLKAVLNAGGDVSTADIYGAHPLHYSTQVGEHGLPVTFRQSEGKRRHKRNASIGKAHDGFSDTRKSSTDILKLLLDRNADVNATDNEGRTPLIWAASSGNSEALTTLVKSGAEIVQQDRDGLSALHCASSRGHFRCTEILVMICGADVHQTDTSGCTPLFYAVALGHGDCVRLLIENGSDVDLQDNKGRTAAHCGASKGQLETLKILRQHGADLWMRNIRGDLPLHEAVKSGRKDLVKWLLEHGPKGAINEANQYGRTALHIAAFNNQLEMAQLLLESGANLNPSMRIRTQSLTPLDAANQNGAELVAQYLKSIGGKASAQMASKASDLKGAKQSKDKGKQHRLSDESDGGQSNADEFNLEHHPLHRQYKQMLKRSAAGNGFGDDSEGDNDGNKYTKLPNLVQNSSSNDENNGSRAASRTHLSTASSLVDRSSPQSPNRIHNVREYETTINTLDGKSTHLKQAIITNVYLTAPGFIGGGVSPTGSATSNGNTPVYYLKRVPPLKKPHHGKGMKQSRTTRSRSRSGGNNSAGGTHMKDTKEPRDSDLQNGVPMGASVILEAHDTFENKGEVLEENFIVRKDLKPMSDGDDRKRKLSRDISFLDDKDRNDKEIIHEKLSGEGNESDQMNTQKKKEINEENDSNDEEKDKSNQKKIVRKLTFNALESEDDNGMKHKEERGEDKQDDDDDDVRKKRSTLLYEEDAKDEKIKKDEDSETEDIKEKDEHYDKDSETEDIKEKDKHYDKDSETENIKEKDKHYDKDSETENIKEKDKHYDKDSDRDEHDIQDDKNKAFKINRKQSIKLTSATKDMQESHDSDNDDKEDSIVKNFVKNVREDSIDQNADKADEVKNRPSSTDSKSGKVQSRQGSAASVSSTSSTSSATSKMSSSSKKSSVLKEQTEKLKKNEEEKKDFDDKEKRKETEEKKKDEDENEKEKEANARKIIRQERSTLGSMIENDDDDDNRSVIIKNDDDDREKVIKKEEEKTSKTEDDKELRPESPSMLEKVENYVDDKVSDAKEATHKMYSDTKASIKSGFGKMFGNGDKKDSKDSEDDEIEAKVKKATLKKQESSKPDSPDILEKLERGVKDGYEDVKEKTGEVVEDTGDAIEKGVDKLFGRRKSINVSDAEKKDDIKSKQVDDDKDDIKNKQVDDDDDEEKISKDGSRKNSKSFLDKFEDKVEETAKDVKDATKEAAEDTKDAVESGYNKLFGRKASRSDNEKEDESDKENKDESSAAAKKRSERSIVDSHDKKGDSDDETIKNIAKDTKEKVDESVEETQSAFATGIDSLVPSQDHYDAGTDSGEDKSKKKRGSYSKHLQVPGQHRKSIDDSETEDDRASVATYVHEGENTHSRRVSAQSGVSGENAHSDDGGGPFILPKFVKGKHSKKYDHVKSKVSSFWNENDPTKPPPKSRITEKHHPQQNQSEAPMMSSSKSHQNVAISDDDLPPPMDVHGLEEDYYKQIEPAIINQSVEKYLRKYYLERKLFEELYDLKRHQIRTGKSNEPQLVKRLVDRFRKEHRAPGMGDFTGPYSYRAYELFLYDQLRRLSRSNEKKIAFIDKSISYEDLNGSSFEKSDIDINEMARDAEEHLRRRQQFRRQSSSAELRKTHREEEHKTKAEHEHGRASGEGGLSYDKRPYGLSVNYRYEYQKTQHLSPNGDGELVDVVHENVYKRTGMNGSKLDEWAISRKVVEKSPQPGDGPAESNKESSKDDHEKVRTTQQSKDQSIQLPKFSFVPCPSSRSQSSAADILAVQSSMKPVQTKKRSPIRPCQMELRSSSKNSDNFSQLMSRDARQNMKRPPQKRPRTRYRVPKPSSATIRERWAPFKTKSSQSNSDADGDDVWFEVNKIWRQYYDNVDKLDSSIYKKLGFYPSHLPFNYPHTMINVNSSKGQQNRKYSLKK